MSDLKGNKESLHIMMVASYAEAKKPRLGWVSLWIVKLLL